MRPSPSAFAAASRTRDGAGSDGWPTAIEITGMAQRFQPVGLGQHVHRVERLDIAAARKRNSHGSALSDFSATRFAAGAALNARRAAQMPE